MNQRRKYISFLLKRLAKLVREVEFYLLVPSDNDKLRKSLDNLASEVQDIKKKTEDYD